MAKQFQIMRSIQKCIKTSNIPNTKCAVLFFTVAELSGCFYLNHFAPTEVEGNQKLDMYLHDINIPT